MSVSLENQFYLELGIIKGWALILDRDIPARIHEAIEKLHGLGLGVIGKSEDQLREEVEAQAHLLNEAMNDIDDLKRLGNPAVRQMVTTLPCAQSPLNHVRTAEIELMLKGVEAMKAESATAPAANTTDQLDKRCGWTPERRTAQAERAKGRKKPPYDDDLDAVKADFDAGLSLDRIGDKFGCSGSHIRNFLSKHGIDPRRSVTGTHKGRPPLSDEEIQLIIDEKSNGTPSKEIGERIDRSQHAVDQKYSDLKNAGLVPEEHLTPEALAEKKRRQNEMVSEKMKAHHAGKMEEPQETQTRPLPDSPASRWKPVPIADDEWPDVQQMLANGRTREAIAGDFDVPADVLDAFIECKLEEARGRREAKEQPPGEARAPLH